MLGAKIDSFFDPANSVAVGAWGLILGIGGSAIALIGFGITIWQLVRTKKAVEAATEAASAQRAKIASQTAILHAVTAIARLKAARRELRSKEWSAALFILEELRQSLVIIDRRKHFSNERIIQDLPGYLKDLLDYIDYIDRRGDNEIPDRKKNQMLSRLSELSNLLEHVADDLAENAK